MEIEESKCTGQRLCVLVLLTAARASGSHKSALLVLQLRTFRSSRKLLEQGVEEMGETMPVGSKKCVSVHRLYTSRLLICGLCISSTNSEKA
ncbi:hypothetical protein DFH11DRAFT_1593875 [Phellopilus nigrolimitatus]|nr:hypothetical protein DFH11DRAFT_1593875 [Phellopilus nigrolimitatus]